MILLSLKQTIEEILAAKPLASSSSLFKKRGGGQESRSKVLNLKNIA